MSLWMTTATAEAVWIGSYHWQVDDPDFGGFSAIEITEDGAGFLALGDRGVFAQGTFSRADGVISAVMLEGLTMMTPPAGEQIAHIDSEGLAVARDGSMFVSFESTTGLREFDSLTAAAGPLLSTPAFAGMQRNGSLEALAIGPDGALYTIPERSGRAAHPFQVFRLRDGVWDEPFSIPRTGPYLVVGADFGPDGRLYVLERDFVGIGFRNRIRRFEIDGSGAKTLLETRIMTHDNLEGISVWHDADGLRMTLISDDNFREFQRTEIVEYRLTD